MTEQTVPSDQAPVGTNQPRPRSHPVRSLANEDTCIQSDAPESDTLAWLHAAVRSVARFTIRSPLAPQLPHVAFLSLTLPAWLSLPPAVPRAEPSCWRSCIPPQMQTTQVRSNHQCLLAVLIASVYLGAPEWTSMRGGHFKFTVMHDPPRVRRTGCLNRCTAVPHFLS